MRRLNWIVLCTGVVLGTTAVAVRSAAAQAVTTGSISGIVEDQQGGRLPGAVAEATHVGTGTVYTGVSQVDGRFSILNVRIGIYTVKVRMPSFRDSEQKDVIVNLGEDRALVFRLELATVTQEVTVTAASPLIDVSRAGTAANIGSAVKESLPTIERSMFDIARLNPYFSPVGFNDGPLVPSVAGRNNRYNSIQIDGAVNNDLFGLAASGTPGGQTDTQPISLDAIEELQLVISPYDVRQGGFSGGGLNAVTKMGTNAIKGSVFYFARNQSWVGKGIDNRAISTFSDRQGGFSVGGPMARNRAFFFGTLDYGRKSTPSGFSVSGSGQQFGRTADIDRFLNILSTRYGYDLGASARDEFTRTTNSDKAFVRADFNIASGHRLTARHNYVFGVNDIGSPSLTFYLMPDRFYHIKDRTNSTVVQLNSALGNAANELRVTFTTIRNNRGGQGFEPRAFPMVTVDIATGVQVVAGRENFSTANALDQDIIEVNDDYTLLRGRHTITVGTHNEFFSFRNLFIRDNFGSYRFSSLDMFEQGLAQSFDYSFSATSNPKQAAQFSVNQFGFYAGDQWRIKPQLTLTTGLRVDVPRFPDIPTANPASEQFFGYRTDVVPSTVLWSPRVGFNWDRKGDGSEQVRGGIGLFAGRTPYVWLSNQYGNTGIEFTRIGASFSSANRIPFVPDALNQPKTVTGASGSSFTNEIDLVDPDYQFPSVLRGNLAYDRQLPGGIVGTVEVLFTNNVQDIKYQNLNLVQTSSQNIDGRPRHSRPVTSLSDVIFLTNSSEGNTWSLVLEARRPFRGGWFVSGSYLYGRSRSIMDGTSSQAASNWGFVYTPGDPNNAPMTVSDFDPGHRINLSGAYDFRLGRGYTATLSMYYSGQSGRPYSLTWSNDVNGDGRTTNDLLYLPKRTDTLTYTGGTYDTLLVLFDQYDCMRGQIGSIHDRNSCRGPWINILDARVNVGLPFRRVKAEVTLDILNVTNLIDSKSGLYRYIANNRLGVFGPVFTSGQITGVNVTTIASPTFRVPTRNDLRSRWQMQLGARLRF
jgi:hypothetical protein